MTNAIFIVQILIIPDGFLKILVSWTNATLMIIILLAKTTATQNEVALSYCLLQSARAIFSGSCFCEKYNVITLANSYVKILCIHVSIYKAKLLNRFHSI